MTVETVLIKPGEAGLRLDRWFRVHFPDVSYGYLQKLLRSGQVRVDARRVQANARLTAGQQVRVDQGALGWVDGAEHVHAKREPGVAAVPGGSHGASPRSCSASLSAFNA